jgi:hypothetical protein
MLLQAETINNLIVVKYVSARITDDCRTASWKNYREHSVVYVLTTTNVLFTVPVKRFEISARFESAGSHELRTVNIALL